MADQDTDLLKQIEPLVRQYLALGSDTPLYDQFKSVLSDVQSALQEEAGESPAEEAAEPPEGGGGSAYSKGASNGAPADHMPTNFKEARAKAGADMKAGKVQPKGRRVMPEALQAAIKKRRQETTKA